MALVEKTVTVHAPIDSVAAAWRQVESFPRVMDGVQEVERVSADRSRWVVTLGGARTEFEAVATSNEDPRRIVWRSVSGRRHCGVVAFDALDGAHTRVTARMAVEPGSLAERIGLGLGLLGMRVSLALRQFRDYLESATRTRQDERRLDEQPLGEQRSEEASFGGQPRGAPGTPFGPVPPFTDPRHR